MKIFIILVLLFSLTACTTMTPLTKAARKGDVQTMQTLIKNGADVNEASKGKYKATPIIWALQQVLSEEKTLETIKLLVENGADFNTPDESGYTPLQYAVDHGQTEVVRYLIQKGADKNNRQIFYGSYWSRLSEDTIIEIIKLLIDNGANVNKPDESGYTILYYIVTYDQIKVVRFLIKKGADPNAKGSDGLTPLEYAKRYKFSTITKILESVPTYKLKYSLSAAPQAEVPDGVLKKMQDQIQKRLFGQNLLASETDDKFRKVDILITHYRLRPDAARLVVDSSAGCDQINSKVKITDSNTNKTIDEATFESRQCAAGGRAAHQAYLHIGKVTDYLSGK